MEKRLKDVILAALVAAIEFVVTFVLRIPVPGLTSAYVNMGDSIIYSFASYRSSVFIAVACGLGAALCDIAAGAAIYILPTFIIKMCMALVAMLIFKNKQGLSGYLLGSIAAGLLMVVGYFLVEWIFYGIPGAAIGIGPNLLQCAFGVIISIPLYYGLKRIKQNQNY